MMNEAHSCLGKHSTKKDDYLETLMLVPPKQHIPIRMFDVDTETEGFSVSLEGLKGVCIMEYRPSIVGY